MGQRAIEAILGIDQITIAAWRGAAMGGGACVATACDFRVGSNSAFMEYPEVNLGINLMEELATDISLGRPSQNQALGRWGRTRKGRDTLRLGNFGPPYNRSASEQQSTGNGRSLCKQTADSRSNDQAIYE